jgi:hypothetical protein
MYAAKAADGRRQIIVAFWQRSATGIEFYVPLDRSYMEALSHRAAGRSAETARSWVEQRFGLNPRSAARVFTTTPAEAVVAFTLTAAELSTVSKQMIGAWVSAWSLADPLNQMFSHVERHLA